MPMTAPSLTRAASPARRRRIVQVIPTFRIAGLEKMVVRLTEHLRVDTDQLVLTPGPNGPLRGLFAPDVRVVALGDGHRSGRWNVVSMARCFRAFKPDVVHSRNWTCIDAILAARLSGVPTVIHGEHGREATDPEGRNPLRRRVRRLLVPLVTCFVTVSRDLARWLATDVGVPAGKIRHIPNGVDLERFARGDRAAGRAALAAPDGCTVIGAVGRLEPVKDHAGLIQAFASLAPRHRALLYLVGDGPSRADLERLVHTLHVADRVRFLGERHDVPLILRGLDLFVLSSVGEGMSNCLLEAMASGLPIVATAVGGNTELVEDGVTGVLVWPRAPEALAARIQQYLDDPDLMTRHGRAARARVETTFPLTRTLSAYRELYDRFVGARSRA
jgi:sugar transferase (PEP-CTERM/EpsH1 system associated)